MHCAPGHRLLLNPILHTIHACYCVDVCAQMPRLIRGSLSMRDPVPKLRQKQIPTRGIECKAPREILPGPSGAGPPASQCRTPSLPRVSHCAMPTSSPHGDARPVHFIMARRSGVGVPASLKSDPEIYSFRTARKRVGCFDRHGDVYGSPCCEESLCWRRLETDPATKVWR